MHTRLKSPLVLGFILPGLILCVAISGSLQLYFHTVKTARFRLAMLTEQRELEIKLTSTSEERTSMETWMKTVRGYFDTASIDGFVSALINSSDLKPEIISSSSVLLQSYEGIHLKSAQQFTLRGSSNTLIRAFARAQMAFPAIFPIDWQLKRAPKVDALEMQARFIVPEPATLQTTDSKIKKTLN